MERRCDLQSVSSPCDAESTHFCQFSTHYSFSARGVASASMEAGSFMTRTAAINALMARKYRPAASDLKYCSNHVLTLGATNPPRFPNALIVAIPAAAPTPPKYAVGNVQKIGCA